MALRNLLERLDLLSNKVVFFLNEENSNAPVFSPEIQKKLNIIKPDAYYSFNNKPYILFFDLENEKNTQREDDIHKKVWSFDYTPIIFIVKGNEIKIFNAFSYNKKTERLKEIELDEGESIYNFFSFWKLQSGETWNWIQEKKYSDSISKKRVNQKLFDNIKEVREKLCENGLSEEDSNILILRLIFIRYLIDRNVKIDKTYISGDSVFKSRKSFSDIILDSTRLNQFFDYLNDRFNGVLFKNKNIVLSPLQANSLAQVFNEKTNRNLPTLFDNLDDFYFEIFDFSIIPVEVISGIYESLIDKEKKQETSAVYTPSFLVEYILKETVDKYLEEKGTSECKIFDPACGSGIFLVQSLRRMVDKEAELNRNIFTKKEFSKRIREIVKNNLFGIDINEQALKVACFSIYVALLDYQEPKDIDKYSFPNLIGENLFEANFFKDNDEQGVAYKKIIDSKNINCILGNPPWKTDKEQSHIDWLKAHKKVTGRYEIAQSYLLRSKDFMTENTISSLIVTSTIFYNISKTTKAFKKEFLTTFCLNTFFDLSPVRRLVFEGEKIKIDINGEEKKEKYSNPASVLIYRKSRNEDYKNNVVKHYSVKSNIFLKHFKSIVIEKNDQKEILQKHFIENDWMFKVALYGNTLDFFFIKRLTQDTKKVIDLIDNKVIFKGAGIHKGSPSKYKSFLPIIGKTLIDNSEIQQYFTKSDSTIIITNKESHIKSGKEKGLYEGSQILLKEQAKNESKIVVSFSDKNYAIKSGIFAISSKIEYKTLKVLYSYFLSNIYSYYIYSTSGSWGVSTRPQIRLDEEYLSFPYKEMSERERKELVNLVDNFLQPFKKHYNQEFPMGDPPVSYDVLSEINEKINTLYEVSEIEKDLIDYVLEVSRYQFQESKQHKVLNFRNKEDDLRKYSEVFLKEFSNVYEDEFLKVEIYPLNHFIAIIFRFVKEKLSEKEQIKIIYDNNSEKEVLSKISDKLTIWSITDCKNPENNIYIQKDIKGFEKDSFYIIKPNEYKCWHRAMAWYDLTEIKEAIEKAELNHLNKSADVF